jgi:hypothetical protein
MPDNTIDVQNALGSVADRLARVSDVLTEAVKNGTIDEERAVELFDTIAPSLDRLIGGVAEITGLTPPEGWPFAPAEPATAA